MGISSPVGFSVWCGFVLFASVQYRSHWAFYVEVHAHFTSALLVGDSWDCAHVAGQYRAVLKLGQCGLETCNNKKAWPCIWLVEKMQGLGTMENNNTGVARRTWSLGLENVVIIIITKAWYGLRGGSSRFQTMLRRKFVSDAHCAPGPRHVC